MVGKKTQVSHEKCRGWRKVGWSGDLEGTSDGVFFSRVRAAREEPWVGSSRLMSSADLVQFKYTPDLMELQLVCFSSFPPQWLNSASARPQRPLQL